MPQDKRNDKSDVSMSSLGKKQFSNQSSKDWKRSQLINKQKQETVIAVEATVTSLLHYPCLQMPVF